MDKFSGQMTQNVLDELQQNNVLLTRVPARITHQFQVLDLIENGYGTVHEEKSLTISILVKSSSS